MGVKNSDDLRNIHTELQPSVIKLYQSLGQSKEYFSALNQIKNDVKTYNLLDEGQKRIINSELRQMVHSGVGLDESNRDTFNKLQLEASELSTKFSNNVLDSTKEFQ